MKKDRVSACAAAAIFLVMPLSYAWPLDTLRGIEPPTLKPTLPVVQPPPVVQPLPAVKPAQPASQVPAPAVRAGGTIRERGPTSYMYGTHVLVDDGDRTLYALKSDHIDLGLYTGRRVTVSGDFVKGYPVDNGPPFLNVTSLREEGGSGTKR